ncbi:MAG: hypothetical protein HY300_20640, partial [Verrucomicrobia bacterium]|nr:hypothetical protein [Verrucomicrobiota bacterium]
SQQRAEALGLFKGALLPAYSKYTTAADRLLDYNVRVGQDRGREIMRTCTLTQWAVAIVGIVLFLVGFWTAMFESTEEEKRLMRQQYGV